MDASHTIQCYLSFDVITQPRGGTGKPGCAPPATSAASAQGAGRALRGLISAPAEAEGRRHPSPAVSSHGAVSRPRDRLQEWRPSGGAFYRSRGRENGACGTAAHVPPGVAPARSGPTFFKEKDYGYQTTACGVFQPHRDHRTDVAAGGGRFWLRRDGVARLGRPGNAGASVGLRRG